MPAKEAKDFVERHDYDRGGSKTLSDFKSELKPNSTSKN